MIARMDRRRRRIGRALIVPLVLAGTFCSEARGQSNERRDLPKLDQPLAAGGELSVEGVIEQVLARNPTLAQMVAAAQMAATRYPQVTSLDDPMFETMLAPASIGSNNVEFGYRVALSQKY